MCRAGIATACPSSGRSRSSIAPRARTRTRSRSTSSAASAARFAQYWVDTQREEFKRLGVVGDWGNPYLTMSFDAEAQIARELMKVAATGQLYRGSKPVMWSVVERTALAEAEIEYPDYESDAIWVKFPIHSANGAFGTGSFEDFGSSYVVIWTTTPWTIPANRAISYSSEDQLRPLRGHRRAGGQLGVEGREIRPRRQARRRDVFAEGQGRDLRPPARCRLFQDRLLQRTRLRGLAGGYELRSAAARWRARHR